MINFLAGAVVGGAIVLIILCAFAVNHDKPKHTTATGTEFWRELLPDLREAVGPAAYPFFDNRAMCMGTLNGDTLTIQIRDEFSCRMVNKPKVLKGIETAASAKAGRPIAVVLLHNGEVDDG